MALQKLAHAVLRVQEMETALEFNTEILGLTELGRDGNTVYLGCGVDCHARQVLSTNIWELSFMYDVY